jgi:hypothetical protein
VSLISGKFYRYRKIYKGASRVDLKVGDTYRFEVERDLYPAFVKDFSMTNATGELFELSCSYQALDTYRIEEALEEVTKPSWWDSRGATIEGI